MLRTPVKKLTALTKLTATALSAGVIITGVTAMSGGAGAYGGEVGQLLVKGPGTGYTATTGKGTIVSIETTAGATASYGLEVKNTSTTTEQYNLTVETGSYSCSPTCQQPPTTVAAGSLVLTTLTAGPNGYFTAPIAPGKTAAYTVKVTIPAGTIPSGNINTYVQFFDTAHNQISGATLNTNVTETKGTIANDQLVSGASGQKPVGDAHQLSSFVTDPSVKLGGTSAFSIKLQNDSTAPTQITEHISDYANCAAYFPIRIKAGTVDVTSLVLAGTYVTPVLAAGKSTTLTATVTYASTPVGCTYDSDVWLSTSTVGSDERDVLLVTNPIAS